MLKIPKSKRKPGMRAGLTHDKIAAAAIKLWCAKPPEDFSVRALAKALGVAPVTIRAHFKGGAGDILNEIARVFLDELAKPYSPELDAKTYLKDIFSIALMHFPDSPSISRQVVLRLADRPFLSPQFAERVCATLLSLAPKADPAAGLELVVNRLSGLLLVETGEWATASPAAADKEIKDILADLPTSEFPTLHKIADQLGKHPAKRAKQNYVDDLASAATQEIIAALTSAKHK